MPQNNMRIIPIIILLFIFSTIYAQTELNLTDCLEYAYKHNPEIQQYSNNIKKSNLNLKQSKLNSLPTAYVESNDYLQSGRSLNIETYTWDDEDIQQTDLSLVADLVVFKGLYNLYKKNY